VGKVCNLCRVLETGISVVLTIMSSLGSSSIRRAMVTFMMMINNGDYNPDLWYFLFDGVPLVITGLLLKFGSTYNNKT
jgi:histone acetyltransferase (RNA polymerase elongator complex component)